MRHSAGLGSPPVSFYNNRSESINKLLKKEFHHQKSSLPQFVKQLFKFVQEQSVSKRKADIQSGDRRLQDSSSEATTTLSCSNDSINLPGIDKSILDTIWEKAAHLVGSNGFITAIAGDPTGKGKMVASGGSCPHMVVPGKKNDNVFCVF